MRPYSIIGSGGFDNWAGWNTASSSNIYTGAQATFTVPSLTTSTCGNHALGIWTGLGGVDTGNFSQSGIGWDDPTSNAWAPWYEYFVDGDGVAPQPLPAVSGTDTAAGIKSGNVVFSVTYYNTTNHDATFEVLNKTTGGEWSHVMTSASDYFDGTTADFEMEEPQYNGSNAATIRFSAVSLTGDNARTSSGWHTLGSQRDEGNFIGDSDYVVEEGNVSSSGTSFPDTWMNCN